MQGQEVVIGGYQYRPELKGIDAVTGVSVGIDYVHKELHDGSHFFIVYSVASLGAMAAPDDMITLTFTTPNTTKWGHFVFTAKGTGGWRVRLIEAPTGGAETQTEQLPVLNSNRNMASTKVSTVIALDSTAGEISYDATLATGGITLIDEYITGTGQFSSAAEIGSRDEIVLMQNTKYQASLYGTDTDPATLHLTWYEHTNANTPT